MLALAQEVVRQGRHDTDFLERYTSGSKLFLDYLAGVSDGEEKTAEWAAAITGLEADAIRQLALRLAETRSMITVSWSLQRAQHGEQPYWAAVGLACVLGQLGLPGGGVGFGYGSLGGMGAAIPLSRSPSMPQLQKPIQSFIPVARITDLLLNPGGTFDYEGKTHTYPDTRLSTGPAAIPFITIRTRIGWTGRGSAPKRSLCRTPCGRPPRDALTSCCRLRRRWSATT